MFVGTDTAGEDDLWRFYNVTRGRDYIHLMFLRTLRFYLGRFNINGQTIEAIGQAARREIAEAADQPVHLFLHVKVRENWADDPARYREMGLEFPRG